MNILRVFSTSPLQKQYQEFYARQHLHECTYSQAILTFKDHYIMYPNFFQDHMQKLGNSCFEIWCDLKALQKKWCDENEEIVNFDRDDWMFQALKRQVCALRPDILYLEKSAFFTIPKEIRTAIVKEFPFLKLITGFLGTQLTPAQIRDFSDIPLLFVGDKLLAEQFSPLNISTQVIMHAFDYEQVRDKFQYEKKYNFVFLGTSGFGSNDHRNRYEDLVRLIETTQIELWCFEPELNLQKLRIRSRLIRLASIFPSFFLKYFNELKPNFLPIKMKNILVDALKTKKNEYQKAWYLNSETLSERFPDRVKEGLLGREYLQVIASSKITFNRHVDQVRHGGNMRCFEATGMRSCLLTDRGELLREFFIPDQEIVCYSSMEEAKEKAEFLLKNELPREQIAEAGMRRTLKDHTSFQRCKKINRCLVQNL